MTPGSTATHVAYIGLNAAFTGAVSVTGSITINGGVAGALTVVQRADLGYTLSGVIPAGAALGASVGMRYTVNLPSTTDTKQVQLGQVLDPTAIMYSPVVVPFDFRVNGLSVTPDTSIQATQNIDGVDAAVIPLNDLGGGSYTASIAVGAPTQSHELLIEAQHAGETIYGSVRAFPMPETNPETITIINAGGATGSTPSQSLDAGTDRTLRIAPVRRPTIRVRR